MPGKRASEDERRTQILRAALKVASRDRLDSLTIRNVATEAGISPGLVFFHFKNKDILLVELLEWLLERILVAEVGPDILAHEQPVDRLLTLIGQEIQRVGVQRVRLSLFFDYWVLGGRDPAIQQLIRAALDRYRTTFHPLAADVLAQAPARYANLTPDGLSMLIASMIQGYTIQTVTETSHTEMEPLMEAIAGLLESMRSTTH